MPSRVTPDHEARRLALYREGMNDGQIGRALGLTDAIVRKWRYRKGLPANAVPGVHPSVMSDGQHAARMLLYRMGFPDTRIAREQRLPHASAIKKWRDRRGLPANARRPRSDRDAPIRQLIEAVRETVGRAGARDIADDAASDMLIAIVSGEVSIDGIAGKGRQFWRRVVADYADKWGARSIDETIAGTDDLALIDTLADERSSTWLEEMGATVW